jgi:hypothetical protein
MTGPVRGVTDLVAATMTESVTGSPFSHANGDLRIARTREVVFSNARVQGRQQAVVGCVGTTPPRAVTALATHSPPLGSPTFVSTDAVAICTASHAAVRGNVVVASAHPVAL